MKAGLGELTVGWAEAAGWVGAAGWSAAAATWGWTVGAVGAFGAAAADTGATAAATTGGLPAPGAGRMGLGPPGRADGVRGRSAVAADPPLPTALFAGLPPFPSPPLAAAAGAGVPTGNASFSLRTTGASIVDEALLTNSPNSLSLAMISLLDLPSSFASSCTRALPATALLTVRPGGRTARPRVSCTGSLLELHGVLTTGRPAFGVCSAGTARRGPDPSVRRPDPDSSGAEMREPLWFRANGTGAGPARTRDDAPRHPGTPHGDAATLPSRGGSAAGQESELLQRQRREAK